MGAKLSLQKNKNENFRIWFNRLTFLISVRFFRPWMWLQTIYEMTVEGRDFKKVLRNMEDFSYSVMRDRADKLKNFKVISKFEPDDNINDASERDTILDSLLKKHLREDRYDLDEVKKDIDSILFAVKKSWARTSREGLQYFHIDRANAGEEASSLAFALPMRK